MDTEATRTELPPNMPDIHWNDGSPELEAWNRGRRVSRPRSPGKSLLSEGTLGGTKILTGNRNSMSTKEYHRLVKRRFKNRPAVYQRFLQIVQEMELLQDSNSRLEMVKQLITLFDGHPDLILNVSTFLPEEYCIEMQDDAVVIKVFEEFGEAKLVDTGHSRAFSNPNKAHSHVPSLGTSVESIGYIVNVKKVYANKTQVYTRFIHLLKDYHSKKVDELNTIHRAVSLFQTRPDLVLGFNEFLPAGYGIHMYEKSGYVIEYPSKGEGGVNRVRIALDKK